MLHYVSLDKWYPDFVINSWRMAVIEQRGLLFPNPHLCTWADVSGQRATVAERLTTVIVFFAFKHVEVPEASSWTRRRVVRLLSAFCVARSSMRSFEMVNSRPLRQSSTRTSPMSASSRSWGLGTERYDTRHWRHLKRAGRRRWVVLSCLVWALANSCSASFRFGRLWRLWITDCYRRDGSRAAAQAFTDFYGVCYPSQRHRSAARQDAPGRRHRVPWVMEEHHEDWAYSTESGSCSSYFRHPLRLPWGGRYQPGAIHQGQGYGTRPRCFWWGSFVQHMKPLAPGPLRRSIEL